MKSFKQYMIESVEFIGWNEANDILKIDAVFRIQPWGQNTSWKMKRTSGKTHADVEPMTLDDTNTMKDTIGFGSDFKTAKYTPVVVEFEGRRFAAALMNVPHAGSNVTPPGKITKKLSGGFDNIVNGDYIKDNGVIGHFCLHFFGSIRHTDNNTDQKAMAAINSINSI